MDNTFKQILEKLTTIESRLGKLETGKRGETDTVVTVKTAMPQRDALFGRALALVDKYEEIPSALLQKELAIDEERANAILDQLEEAGYGSCYFGESKK